MELRGAPYACFGAKAPGLVATLYESGKLVVQGEDPESFLATYVDAEGTNGLRRGAAPSAERGTSAGAVTVIGSDESGKGDYFGPLVVAAVRLDAGLQQRLAGGPVRDCKLMSDESVRAVAGALRSQVPHSIQRLDPPDYNAEHARVRNLNPMLARLHERAIAELAEPGMRVVVDQFANEALLERLLAPLRVELEQRPRGEEELAVAAASVLAREEFLQALGQLSRTWAVDLAKGAGPPADHAARRFVALHGRAALGQVAKLHFRTTIKLFGSAEGSSQAP